MKFFNFSNMSSNSGLYRYVVVRNGRWYIGVVSEGEGTQDQFPVRCTACIPPPPNMSALPSLLQCPRHQY